MEFYRTPKILVLHSVHVVLLPSVQLVQLFLDLLRLLWRPETEIIILGSPKETKPNVGSHKNKFLTELSTEMVWGMKCL